MSEPGDFGTAAAALSAVLSEQDEELRFGVQLHERLPVLLALRNQLDAAVARTVRAGELSGLAEIDGLASMGSWLRGHARVSGPTGSRLLAMGRALQVLPALSAAFAAGQVTADQVLAIAPVTTPEHLAAAEAAGMDLAETDATLTELAASAPHKDVVVAVGHYLSRLDPDGPEPDPTETRGLTLSKRGDGSLGVHGQLDAVGGERLQAALESVLGAGRVAGDVRTRSQQLADSLVQLCDNQLAAGTLPTLRTRKPQVGVLIPWADLQDPATGPGAGVMDFGATISAAKARMLACDGEITRIVIGPDSQPLDVGRTHRVVPPHLRKAVEVRDRRCVFTGCGAPKYWCDVHHLTHWLHGGQTSLANSALLCEAHHTKVHHGFRVERDARNRWTTYRPDGSQISTGPRLDLGPPPGPPTPRPPVDWTALDELEPARPR